VRRFGWWPELLEPDRRLSWGRSSLRYRAGLPQAHSLITEIDLDVLDQGATGSCVAHACAGAYRLRAAVVDHALSLARVSLANYPLPARRWIYRLARETHGEGHIDGGTYISAALYVMRQLGWPDEVHVPWDESRVNNPMGMHARHHAHDQRDAVEEYAITGWGDSRRLELCEAIVSGYPVVFGAHVDQDWLECEDWAAHDLTGEPLGGHAMIACGYEPAGVHVLNSWGSGWGMGGLGLLSWSAVTSRIRDLRVITTVERPTS